MTDPKPLISVLICTYNDEEYLAESVKSILNQTLQEFEFIIVNDGSTDATESIIHSFRDERIVYLKNDHNMGQEYSKNRGINAARGKYIAFQDGDDISAPDRIQIQFDFLEKHDDIGICSTGVQFIGSKTNLYFGPETDEEIRLGFLFSTSMTHATCMIRREILIRNKLKYLDGYLAAEDYWFLSRILEHTKGYCIQKPLYSYRWHGRNFSIESDGLQTENFKKISRRNFEKWLNMRLTEEEHEKIFNFFKKEISLESANDAHSILNKNSIFDNNSKRIKYFRNSLDLRLLRTFVQEGGKGMKNLWMFLESGIWKRLSFFKHYSKYALIVSRSLFRSIVKQNNSILVW